MRSSLLLLLFTVVLAKIDHVKEKAAETHGDATKLKAKEAPEHVDHKKVCESRAFWLQFLSQFVLVADNFKNRRVEHQTAVDSIKKIAKDKRRLFLEDVRLTLEYIFF